MKNTQNLVFSSAEYVGAGHPDKIADQIADAICDACVISGKFNQVACEVLVTKGLVVVAGEFKLDKSVDYQAIAKSVIKKYGYDADAFKYVINVNSQSNDIRASVVKREHIYSGDQGIIFGYATNESKELLPLCFVIARDLVWEAQHLMRQGDLPWAKSDMKSAVTLVKDLDKQIFTLETVIFSIQHNDQVTTDEIKECVINKILKKVIDAHHNVAFHINNLFINSSGRFEIGGLDADTGVTNRKLMVDAGGPIASHGGGGLSGKDLSKVDRSASYFARWICKNLVGAGIASSVELQLVYYLGASKPLNYHLKLSGDAKYTENEIVKCIIDVFPQTIDEVINYFLSHQISYENLSAYGHFGRLDLDLPWERLDKLDEIKEWFQNI